MLRNKLLLLCLVPLLLISCGSKESDLPDLSSMGNVQAVVREEGSGTAYEFSLLVGGAASGKTVLSTSQVIEAVAEDRNAIGYVAYSALGEEEKDRVKVLKVEGMPCDPAAIRTGRYPLERKYLLCNIGSLSDLETDFITYCRTAGQAVASELCLPVRETARFLSSGDEGVIKIAGSSSMEALLRALIEDYERMNPHARIELTVTDSTEGLNAAMRGQADLAASSRSLQSYEAELLEQHEIASDGIAVIVNKDNPLEDISLKRLRSLFDGSVKAWADLK